MYDMCWNLNSQQLLGPFHKNAPGFILNLSSRFLVILMKCLLKRPGEISQLTGFDLDLFETSFLITDHIFFGSVALNELISL